MYKLHFVLNQRPYDDEDLHLIKEQMWLHHKDFFKGYYKMLNTSQRRAASYLYRVGVRAPYRFSHGSKVATGGINFDLVRDQRFFTMYNRIVKELRNPPRKKRRHYRREELPLYVQAELARLEAIPDRRAQFKPRII